LRAFAIVPVLGDEPKNTNDARRWARLKARRYITASWEVNQMSEECGHAIGHCKRPERLGMACDMRRLLYRLELARLRPLHEWLAQYEQAWKTA
jgi:hypothetical protein